MNDPKEFYLKEFKILFNSGLKEEVKNETKLMNSLLLKILSLKRFEEKILFYNTGIDKIVLKDGDKNLINDSLDNKFENSEINIYDVPYLNEENDDDDE